MKEADVRRIVREELEKLQTGGLPRDRMTSDAALGNLASPLDPRQKKPQ